jgi:ATP-dependent RNA helicase DDX52/ROK1
MDLFSLLSAGTNFKKDHGNKKEKDAGKKLRVTRKGEDLPPALESFSEVIENISLEPTLIQQHAIPILLKKRDLIAISPTGSGKTLAFLTPIFVGKLNALIIIPTRELEQQIKREIKKYSNDSIIVNLDNFNARDLKKSTKNKIFISTPLKVVNVLKKGLKLDIEFLVIDECDKLLDGDGFLEQIDEILSMLPNGTQKALFSATIPSSIEEIANTFMINPAKITCGLVNTNTNIKQELIYVGQEEGKLLEVRNLLQKGIKPPILIFVQSIERAKELFHELVYDSVNVDVIHSERTKAARDSIIQNFRMGKIFVLISTELMARGIDFKGVGCVINYDFPVSVQSYLHRIGRTGRAGRDGLAYTFFTKEDAPYLKMITNVMKESGCEVPDWMLKLKAPSKKMKQDLKQQARDRDAINTISDYDRKKIAKKKEMIEGSLNRKRKLQQNQNLAKKIKE